MQQAIYNTIDGIQTAKTTTGNSWEGLARKWDLYGVLVLMASSTTYGVFALMHCGL